MSDNGTGNDFQDTDDLAEDVLYTVLDDDRRLELEGMLGSKVVGVEIWEESLGDEENEPTLSAEERVVFDCDLFLESGEALELYMASAHPDPEADPVTGVDAIFDAVGKLVDDELALTDFDEADKEGGVALAFGRDDQVDMVLVASAWMVSEWEPEEEGEDEDVE